MQGLSLELVVQQPATYCVVGSIPVDFGPKQSGWLKSQLSDPSFTQMCCPPMFTSKQRASSAVPACHVDSSAHALGSGWIHFSNLTAALRPIPPARLLPPPARLRPPRRHREEREWPPWTPACARGPSTA